MSIHNVLTGNRITNNAKEITSGLAVIPDIPTLARQGKNCIKTQADAFMMLLTAPVVNRQAAPVILL